MLKEKNHMICGTAHRTVMYINLATDPPTERIATPRYALTAAEYLAYDLGCHVLVILTDMTAYGEAVREISSAMGKYPAAKGIRGTCTRTLRVFTSRPVL